MSNKDKIETYYSNARELVKRNMPKEARLYILKILNIALESYQKSQSIMSKVGTGAFLKKWLLVSRDLYDYGVTDYVLECFELNNNINKKVNIAAKNKNTDEIDFNGLLEETKENQGWCSILFEKNLNSVLRIKTVSGSETSTGTGFIISDSGYFITNDHIVYDENNSCYYKKIQFSIGDNKNYYNASMLFSDAKLDLAFCKFEPTLNMNFKKVEIIENYSELKQGADILIIGNAFNKGLAPFTGIVKYTNDDTGDLIYQAPSNLGDSGAPIFNRFGKCIGLNKAKTTKINNNEVDLFSNATPINKIMDTLNKYLKINNIEL